MRYELFFDYAQGASHIKKGLPCQDRALGRQFGDSQICIVADGHGNRRHFRSENGAELACKTTLYEIQEFIKREDRSEEAIQNLKMSICMSWRREVMAYSQDHPWTEEELKEQEQLLSPEKYERLVAGRALFLPYGCTLVAIFTVADGWIGLQLGDGAITVVDGDGTYRWPMPESKINEGHFTASICSENPMEDFRHIYEKKLPPVLLAYSDGIEKTFPPMGREIISFLHWAWNNRKEYLKNPSPDRQDTLRKNLSMLSARSKIGDDMSLAGILDLDAETRKPKAGQKQKTQLLREMEAQLKEVTNTIIYNQNVLIELDPECETSNKIRQILLRKKNERKQLFEEINQLKQLLGQEPYLYEEIPEPEQKKTVQNELHAEDERNSDDAEEDESEMNQGKADEFDSSSQEELQTEEQRENQTEQREQRNHLDDQPGDSGSQQGQLVDTIESVDTRELMHTILKRIFKQ